MSIKGKLKLQFTKKPKKKLPKLPDRIKFTNRKGKTFILKKKPPKPFRRINTRTLASKLINEA